MTRTTRFSVNSVDTSAQSGTIYLAVYAGLNQADQTHSDDGVQSAELNFTSTGTIGDGSSLGLTPASGFGSGPVASTGASTDLNGDGNLDLGSTNNASPAGWAIFCQSTGVYATGTGTADGSGDRTNILLGVVAYTYANATNGQTSQITLDSRAGTLSPVFVYEADGVKKFDSFFGSRAGDLAIGTPVTITYTPPETQDVGMSVGAAFVSRSVATSEAGPTAAGDHQNLSRDAERSGVGFRRKCRDRFGHSHSGAARGFRSQCVAAAAQHGRHWHLAGGRSAERRSW